MAVSEFDIARDEQERSNLLRAISDLETAIAVSNPGTRRVLENAAENARKRVTTLDHRIEEAKVARAAEVQAQVVAAAALAARETKLNSKERETYRGFMEESYFTKKDFGKLDEFYAHSYDKLSEGGKDQMSRRFWEGVKQGEYQFADAPSVMQKKEAARAKSHLGLTDLSAKQLGEMSNDQQRAFADAYNSDDRTKAKQILARDSVVLSNDRPVASKVSRPAVKDDQIPDIDLGSIDLKNVQLADVSPVSSASVPDASVSRTNAR